MNNTYAIQFKKISKKFKIGRKQFLKQALLEIFNFKAQQDFWALKDISFEIKRGEAVGIVGTNGSGKSTLLKLIAGVMYPTIGEVNVKGRISPLIELGAGFHPELTGRENIYLNGTVLGLSKKEIDQRFERIVDFSELENFIDTPVKHYSSGMYMRLGFSIAVNTDPDILLVDEVLAVGDIKFQKKCIEKMKDFKKMGVTIIFVSHDLNTISKVCDKVILISDSKMAAIGPSKKVIDRFLTLLGKDD